MKKAVVLLSGGLDSATTLYYAKDKGYKTFCLIFDYAQRHRKEIINAVKIAKYSKSRHKVVKISLPSEKKTRGGVGSSLLDKKITLPKNRNLALKDIPSTYVPARNIIFLSYAASFAETIDARAIFIGANAIDYSGYPDCRPEFYRAYQQALLKGLKSGVQGSSIKIYTPLIRKTKAQIIKQGMRLRVPYHLTWSCYQGLKKPCGKCDSCLLREKGFSSLGITDPIL